MCMISRSLYCVWLSGLLRSCTLFILPTKNWKFCKVKLWKVIVIIIISSSSIIIRSIYQIMFIHFTEFVLFNLAKTGKLFKTTIIIMLWRDYYDSHIFLQITYLEWSTVKTKGFNHLSPVISLVIVELQPIGSLEI